MHLLQNNPIIKLLLFWVVGICYAQYLSSPLWLLLVVALFFALLTLSFSYFSRFSFDLKNACKTWSLAFLFAYVSAWNYATQQKELPHNVTDDKQILLLQLDEPLLKKPKSMQAIFKVLESPEDSLQGLGVLAYLPGQLADSVYQVGQCFVVETKLHKIINSKDFSSFDYASYMASRGVYYQSFLSESDLHPLSVSFLQLKHKSERIRQKIRAIYQQHLTSETYPLVTALTLGYRGDLSKETKAYFQESGMMHILAVSGLHVGMVSVLLSFLLKGIKRYVWGKWIYAFLLLGGIWAYALLTGLSASVQRAAFMFSLIMIAQLLQRRNAIFSSIALSALLILIRQPDLLFQVGFQLSYSAVVAIVSLYDIFNSCFKPKMPLAQWTWSMFSVSLAAQLGTFPWVIYYFHQFPTYFWLSNIVAIPAAGIILFLACAGLLSAGFNPLFTVIFTLLNEVSHALIQFSSLIAHLPYATIQGIEISSFQLILLILSVACVCYAGLTKRWRYVNRALWLVLLTVCSNIVKLFVF